MHEIEPLIPRHGGYQKLKSYRAARLMRDLTGWFCEQYVDERSQLYEQMTEAAYKGAQKIAEGSQAGERSKRTEHRLTTLAQTHLEELQLCYRSYLQQQGLSAWDTNDPRRTELVERKPRRVGDVLQWAEENSRQDGENGQDGQDGHHGREQERDTRSMPSTPARSTPHAEATANGALALIDLAISLIERQLSAQKRVVDHEANLAERLRRKRLAEWPE